MNNKTYSLCIIVDQDKQPMAWCDSSKQLCYCTTDEWQDEHHPVVAYGNKEAAYYIKRTIINRRRKGYEEGIYKTMPFTLVRKSRPKLKK